MMQDDKLIALFEFYAGDKTAFAPRRLPEAAYGEALDRVGDGRGQQFRASAVAHAAWMAGEAIKFIEEAKAGMREPTAQEYLRVARARSKREKAHRWLGFIQGVLWMGGRYSLDELKEHSRGCSDEPDKPETPQ
jgi:hypothetical protein